MVICNVFQCFAGISLIFRPLNTYLHSFFFCRHLSNHNSYGGQNSRFVRLIINTLIYSDKRVCLLTSPYLLDSCSSHPTKELKVSTYFLSTYNYIFFYIATYFFLLNSLTQEVVIPLNPSVGVRLHVFTQVSLLR